MTYPEGQKEYIHTLGGGGGECQFNISWEKKDEEQSSSGGDRLGCLY